MAGVEIPFVAKTIDPDAIKGGSKAARRKEFAKKKWHNELIRFEAQFPNGDTEKFRLPRQKWMREACSNSSSGRSSLFS